MRILQYQATREGEKMTFGWEFACSDVTGTQDLCFNGGTCPANSSSRYSDCICPPGFTADMDWFHFTNCTRPVNLSRWLFIAFAIIIVACLAYLILRVYPGMKSDMTHLARFVVGYWVALFVLVAGIALEDACYELCALGSTVTFLIGDVMCYKVLLLTMSPLYAIQRKPFENARKLLLTWSLVFGAIILSSGLSMCVLTRRDTTRNVYNVSAFICTAAVWVGGTFNMTYIIYTSAKLQRELANMISIAAKVNEAAELNRGSRQLEEEHPPNGGTVLLPTANTRDDPPSAAAMKLRGRLRCLQLGSVAIFIPFLTLFIVVPIVYTHLGSIPYFYVLVFLEISCAVVFGIGFIFFVKKSPPAMFWKFSSSIQFPSGSPSLPTRSPKQTTDSQAIALVKQPLAPDSWFSNNSGRGLLGVRGIRDRSGKPNKDGNQPPPAVDGSLTATSQHAELHVEKQQCVLCPSDTQQTTKMTEIPIE